MAAPAEIKTATKAIRSDSPAPASIAAESSHEDAIDGLDHPIFKELQKNIRNVNKKISNARKVEAIVDLHPGKSLDQLVASRVINKDQKEQILKKPAQVEQLARYEEQLSYATKLSAEFRQRSAAELEKTKEQLQSAALQEKEEAVSAVVAAAAEEKRIAVHDALLVVTQFLRLAALRRSEEADQTLDENKALEGVLSLVYTGDESAVATMLKLVDESCETTTSITGEELTTTYAQVKAAAAQPHIPFSETTEAEPEAAPAAAETATTTEEPVTAPVEEAPGSPQEVSQDWVKVKHEDAQHTPVVEKAEAVVAAEPAEAVPEAAPAAEAEAKAPQEKSTETAQNQQGFSHGQHKSGGHHRSESGRGRGRGNGDWRGRGSYRGNGGRGRGGAGRGGRGGAPQQGGRQGGPRQE